MNENKNFLGTEPIGKLLLRLALPTVAAQMINMLYNIVDRIYIGHIPNAFTLFLHLFHSFPTYIFVEHLRAPQIFPFIPATESQKC